MSWTAARTTELRKLAHNNRSMGEAAEALGVTRNAVAGKAHRENISFACTPETHRARCSRGTKAAWDRDDGTRRKLVDEIGRANLMKRSR